MKIKLNNETIQLRKVRRVRRIGNLAILTLKNGESIHVLCGVNCPESRMPYFSGTYNDLKSLIQRLK